MPKFEAKNIGLLNSKEDISVKLSGPGQVVEYSFTASSDNQGDITVRFRDGLDDSASQIGSALTISPGSTVEDTTRDTEDYDGNTALFLVVEKDSTLTGSEILREYLTDVSITYQENVEVEAGHPTLSGKDTFRGARAYLSANQTIATGTWTKVQLDTESYDTDGDFDPTTNYRFTVPTTGYYRISFGGNYIANGTGRRWLAVWNGTVGTDTQLLTVLAPASSAGASNMIGHASEVFHLTAGDEIHLGTHQDSGGDLDLVSGDNTTFMSVVPEVK